MDYFWTTFQDRGEKVIIENGGRYEALNRESSPASVKRSMNGITPSSDIPELCVSGSPEASLFAKVQSARRPGTYHIYRTTTKPDVKPSRSDLDFGVIEEFRYNMKSKDEVILHTYERVNTSPTIVEHIEQAYNYAEKNSVNRRYAEAIKNGLNQLIQNGNYPSEPFKQAKLEEFKDFASSYGIEQAKRAYNGVPEGFNEDKQN